MIKDPKFFFVSGHSRSGTTYVGELFKSASNCAFLNQPFSLLLRVVKLRYYAEREFDTANLLPLNNCMDFRPYELSDFYNFLDKMKLKQEDFLTWRRLREDSVCMQDELDVGQINELEVRFSDCSLISFFERATCSLYELTNNLELTEPNILGFKEILSAEFTSWFASKGWLVIHVFRHPADVLRSSYFGRAEQFVGKPKSMLFYLNNWRESVQAAIHTRHLSEIVLYEDIISPEGILELKFSELFDFDLRKMSLVNNLNSSNIQKDTRWLSLIEDDLNTVIQPFILPELIFLNYHVPEVKPSLIEDSFDQLIVFSSRLETYIESPLASLTRDDLTREKTRQLQLYSSPSERESLFFSESARAVLAAIRQNKMQK